MIEVEVEDPSWTRVLPTAAEISLEAAALAATTNAEDAAIVILLTDDQTLADLNRQFRGKPGPTNVLAFPGVGAGHRGDIALAFGVCDREAREQDKSLGDHLRHLVIHGVLHLIGHDHQSLDGARRMEAVEIGLLARLGVTNPYVASADRKDDVRQG